jgi:hypothetical protein
VKTEIERNEAMDELDDVESQECWCAHFLIDSITYLFMLKVNDYDEYFEIEKITVAKFW